MDVTRPTIAHCVAGCRAELEGRIDDARRLFAESWECAAGDLDRCVAAHYVGHLETDPVEALRWHLSALEHARLAGAEATADFMPSLYLNLGRAYESLGDEAEATRYFALARGLGAEHRMP